MGGLQSILSKTDEYLNVPAVVRFEQPFLDYLADDFNIPGYDVEKHDRLLVVSKKGFKSQKIVTAHIDRHGIVADKNGNLEYAAFNAKRHYGDENKSSESLLKKSGERFIDELVYAYNQEGKRLAEGRVKSFSYDANSKGLFFEIEGIDKLPAGTAIAYISPLILSDGKVSSQIDNAISAAVAHQLVKDGFDGTLLFATEEEIGKSWQHIASYLLSQGISSNHIITLDTTPYEGDRTIAEGLIVLRNKDEHGIFNPDVVQALKSACDQGGIRYEMKDELIEAQNAQLAEGVKPKKLGTTELGRIIEHTNGKFNGATIQLPATNYHTNHETTSELALNNYYQALKTLL